MRPLVFFGTPEFAVPTLRALADKVDLRPALVVSQPSRPAGRGNRLAEPPVVVAARELGIPFEQVEKVKDPDFLERLRALSPEIAVVVAFGQIFPRALLELPRRGCINLHASLLPRWRGAAPIQAAIRAGDEETGVDTMVMEAGLDTGPVLLERRTSIGSGETAPELAARLAAIGAELMVETLRGLAKGEIAPRAQAAEGATYAPKVTRESARVAWSMPAHEIERAARAFQPWPAIELSFAGEPVKLLRLRLLERDATEAEPAVLEVGRDELVVAAGDGRALAIVRAQRAGRAPVTGGELARALALKPGDALR
jgi:methionyl-tRNA formyltransferase